MNVSCYFSVRKYAVKLLLKKIFGEGAITKLLGRTLSPILPQYTKNTYKFKLYRKFGEKIWQKMVWQKIKNFGGEFFIDYC